MGWFTRNVKIGILVSHSKRLGLAVQLRNSSAIVNGLNVVVLLAQEIMHDGGDYYELTLKTIDGMRQGGFAESVCISQKLYPLFRALGPYYCAPEADGSPNPDATMWHRDYRVVLEALGDTTALDLVGAHISSNQSPPLKK